MLQQLSIQNYALIEQISTKLQPGLTALTGETGSGKSIILGALGLILGERVDSSVLRNQESKCIIEGTFFIDDQFKLFFEENNLDFETHTSIRREITPKGKSRAFINDTPVTLNHLKMLGSKLVDIHSQQEQGRFHELGFRVAILDAAAQSEELAQIYLRNYKSLKSLESELLELEEAEKNARSDQDYVEFQLNELNEAQLDDLNLPELEAKNNLLENAESIQGAMMGVALVLENAESNSIGGLNEALQLLQPLVSEHTGISELFERLQSAKIELQDIVQETESIGESTEMNPAELSLIQSQLDVVYRLQKKHHLHEVQDLMVLKEDLTKRLDSIGHLDHQIQELKNSIAKVKKELVEQANNLSKLRAESGAKLSKEIKKRLEHLGMPDAQLNFDISHLDELGPYGFDQVELMFQANKGGQLLPLNKVASGGETSRVTLALKASMANYKMIKTIILDEIDAGVSGEMALKMAELMKEMSKSMQIISITHLPQVASMAQKQFKVYKTSNEVSTFTHIQELNEEERIQELAEMLSGKNFTKEAIANAKALLKTASV